MEENELHTLLAAVSHSGWSKKRFASVPHQTCSPLSEPQTPAFSLALTLASMKFFPGLLQLTNIAKKLTGGKKGGKKEGEKRSYLPDLQVEAAQKAQCTQQLVHTLCCRWNQI